MRRFAATADEDKDVPLNKEAMDHTCAKYQTQYTNRAHLEAFVRAYLNHVKKRKEWLRQAIAYMESREDNGLLVLTDEDEQRLRTWNAELKQLEE